MISHREDTNTRLITTMGIFISVRRHFTESMATSTAHGGLTHQTVMLDGNPPSIQHGHNPQNNNFIMLLWIGKWGWEVLVYVDIEDNP